MEKNRIEKGYLNVLASVQSPKNESFVGKMCKYQFIHNRKLGSERGMKNNNSFLKGVK